MNEFTVYFVTKQNRKEYLHQITVQAASKTSACATAKMWCQVKLKRNAFRTTANRKDVDVQWYKDNDQYIQHDEVLSDGM